jgi:HEAT repeat protein
MEVHRRANYSLRVRRFLTLILFVCFSGLCQAQQTADAKSLDSKLTEQEIKGLVDCLSVCNSSLTELNFVRRNGEYPTALDLQHIGVDRPLDALNALWKLHSSANGGLSAILGSATRLRSDAFWVPPASPNFVLPKDIPVELGPSVSRIVGVMRVTDDAILAALSGLTREEKRLLIDSLPGMVAGSEAKFDFVKNPPASRDQVQTLMGKVDVDRIVLAGATLASVVEEEIPKLKEAAKTAKVPVTIREEIAGIPVEISGKGPDVHTSMAGGLCIDLGGANTYTGRYGAGVGLASVLIDLGGNSYYNVPDLSIGSGLLGVGLAFEMGGNCVFQGKSLCFGAGIAGLGALLKVGGNDDYRCEQMGEGFASNGIGLLVDTSGDDQYRISTWGQGAGWNNGVGWLVDQAGNDTYTAFSANVQGYGLGGTGLLTDLTGDDFYLGTRLCQGVGQQGGLGSLFDGQGNNRFSADQEAMGFASDIGSAYFFSIIGNDFLAVRRGACFGSAQNRSVAVYFNRSGDDVYAAADGRPGLASDGSLALFMDVAGQDRYLSTPGGAVPGRHGDSLGLFIDLDSLDEYGEGLDNGQVRADADGAVAISGILDESQLPSGPLAKRESEPFVSTEQVDELAFEGTVEAANHLVAIGSPALGSLLERHLDRPSAPILSAILKLSRLAPGVSKPLILAKLATGKPDEIKTALYLSSTLGLGEARNRILELLRSAEFGVEAADAAGILRLESSIADLLLLTHSKNRSLCYASMLALERLGDPKGIEAASFLITNPDYNIRQSAIRLLSEFSASADIQADKLLSDPDIRNKRIGIELLGRVGSPEALLKVGKYLSSPVSGLKIQAMLALDGKCPAALRSQLLSLRDDSDSLVRMTAKRIDLGR